MLILEIALGVLLGGLLLKYFKYFLALGFLALLLAVAILIIVLIGFFLYGFSAEILIGIFTTLVLIYLVLKWKAPDERSVIQDHINKRRELGYDTLSLEKRLKTLEAEIAIKKEMEALKLKETVANNYAIKDAKRINSTISKVSKSALKKELERRKSLGYED